MTQAIGSEPLTVFSPFAATRRNCPRTWPRQPKITCSASCNGPTTKIEIPWFAWYKRLMQIQHVTLLGLTYTTAAIGLLMRGLFQGKGWVIGHAPQVELLKEALERDILDQGPKNWRESIVETNCLIIDWPLADLENLYREIGFRLQPHTLVLDFSRLKGPVYHLAQTHLKTSKFIGVASLLATDQLMMGASSLVAATPDIFKTVTFVWSPIQLSVRKLSTRPLPLAACWGPNPFFPIPWNMMAWPRF